MLSKEQILQIIRTKGPIIPVQISKEINQDILMSSAVLSDLASRKEVKISNLKIGGSPLYYLEGQEPKLQDFSNKLKAKEREAYDLLREKKVLHDKKLEPAMRVAIRQIKDFSVPLKVTYNNQTEIFWKWYLSNNDEVEHIIKEYLGMPKPSSPKPEPETKPLPVQEQQPAEAPEHASGSTPSPVQEPMAKPEPIPITVPEPEPQVTYKQQIPAEPVIKVPPPEPLAVKPTPPSTPIQSSEKSEIKKPARKKQVEKPLEKKEEKPSIPRPFKPQKTEKHPKQKPTPKLTDDAFLSNVDSFFSRNSVRILKKEYIKKGEADYIIKISTIIGEIEYFVKAKSKKRITEPDLSTAILQANEKNLPVLFITNGTLSKNVVDLLATRFKGTIFKKLE